MRIIRILQECCGLPSIQKVQKFFQHGETLLLQEQQLHFLRNLITKFQHLFIHLLMEDQLHYLNCSKWCNLKRKVLSKCNVQSKGHQHMLQVNYHFKLRLSYKDQDWMFLHQVNTKVIQ